MYNEKTAMPIDPNVGCLSKAEPSVVENLNAITDLLDDVLHVALDFLQLVGCEPADANFNLNNNDNMVVHTLVMKEKARLLRDNLMNVRERLMG